MLAHTKIAYVSLGGDILCQVRDIYIPGTHIHVVTTCNALKFGFNVLEC